MYSILKLSQILYVEVISKTTEIHICFIPTLPLFWCIFIFQVVSALLEPTYHHFENHFTKKYLLSIDIKLNYVKIYGNKER